MAQNKYRKFYIDWWKIRRSTIYYLIVLVIFALGFVGVLKWAIQKDWFAAVDTATAPKDAAKIISFEGDVRIIRAATRETIVVTKETFAAAGDTIQTPADGRATLQMIDGSIYTIRPNSTVVIRDNSSLFGGRNVRVSLDDGQLNVRTDDQPENTENVVEMLDSETKLRSQTDASFNADSSKNKKATQVRRHLLLFPRRYRKRLVGKAFDLTILSVAAAGRRAVPERLLSQHVYAAGSQRPSLSR
ncbi:FecR domain-containing protein [Leptolyngbya sp. 7M]|uniref:FecR domain-containing protein n=1 Tax=Leptolyngbya sp. 7M TaxID=2812896 RepID=UPI001B8AE6B0|nr:FecR domain-containing protein [Leptolyngbya sp. 7M]QYO66914.1 FecR family protein [Leptolyngbya sp. 7M]